MDFEDTPEIVFKCLDNCRNKSIHYFYLRIVFLKILFFAWASSLNFH